MDRMQRAHEIVQFANEQAFSLFDGPIRLADIRRKMVDLEEFAAGDLFRRSLVGQISGIVMDYVPLSEWIARYHLERDVYHEHIRNGDLDGRHTRHVRVSSVFVLCESWMHRYHRYPYGDVRQLRPFIADLLAEVETWDDEPHPDYLTELRSWHTALAPGGELYPSDAHIAYAARFEACAEDIIWDNRDQEHITIRNFPAPPRTWPDEPHDRWWCTRHVLTEPLLPGSGGGQW